MKKYKEPEIRFISLKPAEKIANKCWAYANDPNGSPIYYYDLPGTGGLEFKIIGPKYQVFKDGNGCDGGIPTEVHYIVDYDHDGTIDHTEDASSQQIQQLEIAMKTVMGGNSGESTKSSAFEDEFPGWS